MTVQINTEPAPIVQSLPDQMELGALLHSAGLDSVEVRALVSVLEETAKQVSLSMLPFLVKLVQSVHEETCDEIARRLAVETNMVGMLNLDKVSRVIATVRKGGPRH